MTTAVPPPRKQINWLRVLVWAFVITLVLVLALLSSPPLFAVSDQARRAQVKAEVAQIAAALKAYTTEYGASPTGTQAQIITTLQGANPRKIVFYECQPNRINARGEFVDPWKTPYRIDTTNPAFPWAYSFGKDQQDNGGAPGSDDIASW